jgi:hypothetical protein
VRKERNIEEKEKNEIFDIEELPHQHKDLAGRTPMEAILCVLKESNWSLDVKVKDNGSIENLFFAHPGSIHLAQINPHVALQDLTYKTNHY